MLAEESHSLVSDQTWNPPILVLNCSRSSQIFSESEIPSCFLGHFLQFRLGFPWKCCFWLKIIIIILVWIHTGLGQIWAIGIKTLTVETGKSGFDLGQIWSLLAAYSAYSEVRPWLSRIWAPNRKDVIFWPSEFHRPGVRHRLWRCQSYAWTQIFFSSNYQSIVARHTSIWADSPEIFQKGFRFSCIFGMCVLFRILEKTKVTHLLAFFCPKWKF